MKFQQNKKKEIHHTKNEIEKGLRILDEYTQKMERVIEMIREQLPDFDTDQLEDSLDKCKNMLAILKKKESAENEEIEDHKTNVHKKRKEGVSSEEQRILDDWESEMKKIVN